MSMSEMSMSRVRELAKVLLKEPKDVRLNEERANEVALLLQGQALVLPTWDFLPCYPQSESFEEMCQFYATFNAINYCYFDQDGKKFEDSGLSGSTLASARLCENWEEIKDPSFLAQVDENYLLLVLLRAESPISLVKERTKALRELGVFLRSNVDFSFERLFLKHHKNAYFVSQMLPTYWPSWRDPFFKLAQLFVAMVYGRFQNREDLPISFDSLQDLTVFADYKVPQTLIAMGIIEPSAALLTRLYQNQFLGSGSRKELELRAATILGADLILQALWSAKKDTSINPTHVDCLLWSAARKREEMPADVFIKPWPNHHLTLTTDY